MSDWLFYSFSLHLLCVFWPGSLRCLPTYCLLGRISGSPLVTYQIDWHIIGIGTVGQWGNPVERMGWVPR